MDVCIAPQPLGGQIVWLNLKLGSAFVLPLSLGCHGPSGPADQGQPESSDPASLWCFRWGLALPAAGPTLSLSPGPAETRRHPFLCVSRRISSWFSPARQEPAELQCRSLCPFHITPFLSARTGSENRVTAWASPFRLRWDLGHIP